MFTAEQCRRESGELITQMIDEHEPSQDLDGGGPTTPTKKWRVPGDLMIQTPEQLKKLSKGRWLGTAAGCRSLNPKP